MSRDYFPIGIKSQEDVGLHFLLASPEKAICDMLMQEKHVPDQSISRLEVFFEDDMRMDLEDLRQMDGSIIRQCMEVGNKKQVLANLLKLIER